MLLMLLIKINTALCNRIVCLTLLQAVLAYAISYVTLLLPWCAAFEKARSTAYRAMHSLNVAQDY